MGVILELPGESHIVSTIGAVQGAVRGTATGGQGCDAKQALSRLSL